MNRRSMGWLVTAVLIALMAALRFWGLEAYPVVGPDEGIWNVEARDAELFGARGMSGFHNVFLSPLHYGVCWLLFHFAAATCFSVRAMMGILGIVSLGLIWRLVEQESDRRTAATAVLMIGFSYVMIMLNRRAYLESAVVLLSVAAALLVRDMSWKRCLALAACVATLLLYKSNAVYLLPALLLSPAQEGQKGVVGRRVLSMVGGALFALSVLVVLARTAPEFSGPAYLHEIAKLPTHATLARWGRFEIAPAAMLDAFKKLIFGQTDLALLTVVGLLGFVLTRAWRDRFALQVAVWLVNGYAFFLLQQNHPQYFAPLTVPAGILAALVANRAACRRTSWLRARLPALAVAATLCLSLPRLAVGWHQGERRNPPREVLQWLEREVSGSAAFLAAPQVVISTERRSYPFSRIFHPLPPLVAPSLARFLVEHRVRYVIFDQWETAEYFANDQQFLAELSALKHVASGDGWDAFEVPACLCAPTGDEIDADAH